MDGLGLSAYDDVDWIHHLVKYIKEALAQERVKIVGLCFGHQVIGRALGANAAINSLGYELSVCNVALTPLGVRIFGKSELVYQFLLPIDRFMHFSRFSFSLPS